MGIYYILEGHEPVAIDDVHFWSWWFETADRKVDLTMLDNGVKISTVFIGINHGFSIDGPPVLFETMAFDADGEEILQERYCVWDDAQNGHNRIVEEIRGSIRKEMNNWRWLIIPGRKILPIEILPVEVPGGVLYHEASEDAVKYGAFFYVDGQEYLRTWRYGDCRIFTSEASAEDFIS
jgi:hypothetical protein